jgi:hypothetical protein
MSDTEPIIIVYSGKYFRSTYSLTPNSWTFMFTNKNLLTTMDIINVQQKMIAQNALKKSILS